MAEEALRILCVDDNAAVSEALRLTMSRAGGLNCVGCLSTAEGLSEAAERKRAEVVVIDLDMPGPEPFRAIEALCRRCPDVRVVVYTGHVREDLVDRAFDAGVWGYIAKDGPLDSIVWAIREVAAGRVALGLHATGREPGPVAGRVAKNGGGRRQAGDDERDNEPPDPVRGGRDHV